jgi:hypothetical protein
MRHVTCLQAAAPTLCSLKQAERELHLLWGRVVLQ